MGTCFTCCNDNEPIVHTALKLPHGVHSIVIPHASSQFTEYKSIDQWLQSLYASSSWTGWLVYNDETGHLGDPTHKKGHCKGIIAWNESRISFLVHSVPNFPREFTGTTISLIEPGEHIYGQSFCYVERACDATFIQEFLSHIMLMEPHIYIKQNVPTFPVLAKQSSIHIISFSNTITHHAKPPYMEKDIYSDHLASYDTSMWYVETWKRGLPITTKKANVTELEHVTWNQHRWKESQDHSKWAVSSDYVWLGDLNRMTSQYKRGGGGFLLGNNKMASAFMSLCKDVPPPVVQKNIV
jgi:deoxyribonuclease-2